MKCITSRWSRSPWFPAVWHPFRLTLLFTVTALGASCSSPAGPTPPPPTSALTLTCPADVQTGVEEGRAVVQYPLPQAGGGTVPVAVACTIPSGGEFPIGSTPVVCTATDSAARVAQCAFRVHVSAIPRLRGTKIVAFGDSITAGVASDPLPLARPLIDLEGSYPRTLRDLLAARYTAQSITVINEGIPGESVISAAPTGQSGEDRLEDVVLRHRPDVLIVLEGVNGLSSSTVDDISEGLRRGVRRAVRDGVPLVIVSTILPGLPEGTKPPDPKAVDALNHEIRWWAPREAARLADTHPIIAADPRRFIGRDGLHPTPDGFRRMAEHFFEVIKTHFEMPPPAPVPGTNPDSAPPPAGTSSATWRRR